MHYRESAIKRMTFSMKNCFLGLSRSEAETFA